MFCGSSALVKRHPGETLVTALRCNRWSCPECAPNRRKKLIALARQGNPRTFLTLTVSPHHLASPEARAQALTWAWRCLRKCIARRYPNARLAYLSVMEATKRGEPHLHILARMPFVPKKWISEQMARLIGAPIVDIETLNDPNAGARYVAKYVGKAPHRFEGCKRYARTRDYVLPENVWEPAADPYSAVWSKCETSVSQVLAWHARQGARIVREHTLWRVLHPPPRSALPEPSP